MNEFDDCVLIYSLSLRFTALESVGSKIVQPAYPGRGGSAPPLIELKMLQIYLPNFFIFKFSPGTVK